MNNKITEEKKRGSVSWFLIFIALMLFQTNYLRLGTITSLICVFAIIICGYNENNYSLKKIIFPSESFYILLFYFHSTLTSIFHFGLPSYYIRLSAFIILFLFLSNIKKISIVEEKKIEFVYIFACSIYSLLVIWATSMSFTHKRIILFGTSMDPNFIGLPFVTSTIILLNKLFYEKRKGIESYIVIFFSYVILFIGIISTGSRGSFLCWVIGNVLTVIGFVFSRRIKLMYKIIIIALVIILIILVYPYIQNNYLKAFERMTNFGEGADNGRFDIWNSSIRYWKDGIISLICGYGLEGTLCLHGIVNHNTYVEILCETGVIGSVFFLLFILQMIKKAILYNSKYVIVLITMLIQVVFLDSLDNRVLWITFYWIELLSKDKLLKKGWNN